jgi:hypothetical protein
LVPQDYLHPSTTSASRQCPAGSISGANLVCCGGWVVDTLLFSGLMSWDETCAKQRESWIERTFVARCNTWDISRLSILIKFASVAIALASALVEFLKGIDTVGLKAKNQRRWIFSSDEENRLVESGWNPSSPAT